MQVLKPVFAAPEVTTRDFESESKSQRLRVVTQAGDFVVVGPRAVLLRPAALLRGVALPSDGVDLPPLHPSDLVYPARRGHIGGMAVGAALHELFRVGDAPVQPRRRPLRLKMRRAHEYLTIPSVHNALGAALGFSAKRASGVDASRIGLSATLRLFDSCSRRFPAATVHSDGPGRLSTCSACDLPGLPPTASPALASELYGVTKPTMSAVDIMPFSQDALRASTLIGFGAWSGL